jgi:hypothetical protein
MNPIKSCLWLCFLPIFWGCSPNSSTPNIEETIATIDPNVFFTVNIIGTSLTTNGIIPVGLIPYNGHIYGKVSTRNDFNGEFISDFLLQTRGTSLNQLINTSSYTLYSNLPYQKTDATISSEKSGDALGIFSITYGTISDLRIGNKIYDIDYTSGSTLTLTEIGEKYITGQFQCLLIEGSNLIPANGSFRVYKLQ